MPAPGHQHRANGVTTANPFDEQRPHISEYTAQEIATLQARLNRRLGPEYISTRAGPGNSKVAYLSAEKAINLANEVFGFNGWSSSIQNIQIDFVDENPQKGTVSIGLSVVVRVTLRDGTYHEDTGYGGIENCKSKIAAFEKAKKEGTTDALKRALRNFGNVLGNCIYDKDYITKVAKVTKGTGRWDVNDLHRHQDFAPKKQEPVESKPVNAIPQAKPGVAQLQPEVSFDANEFEEADFDELGNPDEMLLPADPELTRPPKQAPPRQPLPQHTTPAKPTQLRPNQGPIVPPQGPIPPRPNEPQQAAVPPAAATQNQAHLDQGLTSRSSSPGVPSQHFAGAQNLPGGMPGGGFYSARAAGSLDDSNNPLSASAAVAFNPYAESPSIRKTSGVDHSKSLALNRHTLKPEPLPQKDSMELRSDQPRKSGVASPGPSAMPSPGPRGMGMSTSAYRPPTRHAPVQGPPANGTAGGPKGGMSTAVKRAPLSDLSNVPGPQSLQEDGESKKPRIGPSGPAGGIVGRNENM